MAGSQLHLWFCFLASLSIGPCALHPIYVPLSFPCSEVFGSCPLYHAVSIVVIFVTLKAFMFQGSAVVHVSIHLPHGFPSWPGPVLATCSSHSRGVQPFCGHTASLCVGASLAQHRLNYETGSGRFHTQMTAQSEQCQGWYSQLAPRESPVFTALISLKPNPR